MTRVVVLDDYQGVALEYADWDVLGAEISVIREPIADDARFIAELAEAEVIVAMRERTAFTASRLAMLPKLRLLVTTGTANAAIDVAAASAHGIVVSGTDSPASATPELTWGLILSLLRSIPLESAGMRDGGWQTTIGGDLAGRRLGIVGLGRLGARMAAVAHAFEMEVVAWSQHLDPAHAAELGVQAVTKEELFETSDVITVHYKLSERSRGIIGAPELARMKPTAMLVNTSRGPLIDTEALLEALHSERIAGAALDVYDVEPLSQGHPLRTAPRMLLTPHLGYVTEQTYRVFYMQAVEDIAAWQSGSPIRQLA